MYGNEPLNTRGIIPENTETFDPTELTTEQRTQLRTFITDINTQLESFLSKPFTVNHSVNPEPNVPYLLINIEHPVGMGLQINVTPNSNDSDIINMDTDSEKYADAVDDTVKMIAAATVMQTRETVGDDLTPLAS